MNRRFKSRWSWIATFAFVALGCITGSLLADGPAAQWLLGIGITAAALGVGSQLLATFRFGHTVD
jgi:hypothetical protein